MKKLLALSVAVFGITACGPIEFDLNKKAAFSVHATESKTYSSKKTIDLSTDKDFSEHKSDLESVEVISATLRIAKSPSESPSNCTFGSGSVLIAADENAEGVKLSTYENLALTQGTSTALTLDAAGAAELKKLAFNSPNKFTVITTGSVDEVPCHFDAEVEIVLTVGASLF